MVAGHLVDLGLLVDLEDARRVAATVAVEELWAAVPDGRDRFDVDGLLAMRGRVADELGSRIGVTGVTLAAISRLLEEAGVPDEALALSVDAIYRDVRDRAARPAPGASAWLTELVDRSRVGLVAVGAIDWRVLGVDVDTVVVPGSLGLHRRDPRLVVRAADRLGVEVGELLVHAPDGSPLLLAAIEAGAATSSAGPSGGGP